VARKKIFAQWPAGLVAVVLVAVVAFVMFGVASVVVREAKAAKDSLVTEIEIDDEGVRVGDQTYRGHGVTVNVGDGIGTHVLNIDGKDIVRFGDDIIVNEGELVEGDAVAILGSLLVNGVIEGDAVAVGGGITVGPTGRIDGDGVAIGGGVSKDPGGVIGGEMVSIGKGGHWAGSWVNGRYIPHHRPVPWGIFSRSGRLLAWIILTFVILLLCLLVTAIARRPVENVCMRARREAFKAGLVGLAAWLLVGPIALLFIITIIGIPVGLVVIPLLFTLAALLGYTGVGMAVGERLGRGTGRSAFMSVTIGIILLQALNLVAGIIRLPGSWLGAIGWMIAFVGWAVIFVAVTIGLGAVILTKFGTARPGTGPARGAAGPVPPQAPVGPQVYTPAA
jgi:hypothetical protein